MNTLESVFFQVIDKVQNPGIIFYWPYVLSAFLVMMVFLMGAKKLSLGSSLKLVFAKNIWFSKSSLVDAVLSLVYAFFISAPSVAWQAFVFYHVGNFLQFEVLSGANFMWPLSFPYAAEAIFVSIYTMLWVDFATYVVHRAFHKYPFLWDIHAVHHSAKELTLFTTHRQHPLEPFMLNTVRAVFAAIGLVLLYFFLPQKTPSLMIMGVGAGFFLYMFTVNLQHSHIPVRYPRWLRPVLMSPHVHHIHHSVDARHHDKNFGVIFPYWDMAFGTYHDEEIEVGELLFGLDERNDPFKQSIIRCYLYPLYSPIRVIFAKIKPN